MPMIPLGLKETNELELRDAIKKIIGSHYHEDGEEFEDPLAELMDLRQAMRTPTRDSHGISLLFQYYNQLPFVERISLDQKTKSPSYTLSGELTFLHILFKLTGYLILQV